MLVGRGGVVLGMEEGGRRSRSRYKGSARACSARLRPGGAEGIAVIDPHWPLPLLATTRCPLHCPLHRPLPPRHHPLPPLDRPLPPLPAMQVLNRTHEDLATACEANVYSLEYLVQAGEARAEDEAAAAAAAAALPEEREEDGADVPMATALSGESGEEEEEAAGLTGGRAHPAKAEAGRKTSGAGGKGASGKRPKAQAKGAVAAKRARPSAATRA